MPDETTLESRVSPNHAGRSLLDYLSTRFRYQTREAWEGLVLSGKVLVNRQKVEPSLILTKGDRVAYSVVLQEPPVDRDIRILHEEETFLVASKPGSLPSHADGNFIKNTFIYILTEMLREKGWKGGVHLVHRLDRETSGLMVAAKDPSAHLNLVKQFEAGLVAKEYLAVARGEVEKESFEVDGPIGKDPESQVSVRQKVVPAGTPYSKPSFTRFERVRALREATLLKCIPKTGRTNQIRVHLDFAEHPIVGDKLYGRTDEEFLDFVHRAKAGEALDWKSPEGAARQMLHASRLAFAHPLTGEAMDFNAEMPGDMREFIESKLGGRYSNGGIS